MTTVLSPSRVVVVVVVVVVLVVELVCVKAEHLYRHSGKTVSEADGC